jgi:hypothetical protein
MNGEHPWRDWLNVLVIFLGGLIIVMMVVRLLIKWAHSDQRESAAVRREDDRPKGGSDKHPQ